MSKLKSFLDKPIMKDGGCVPRREGIWYGLGVAGQNISCGMVGWFYFFCTDVAYYNLGIIASVLTIARIWDAVNDPLMGVLIDRHRFKNGEKLRPWLRIAPIVAGIMATFMFIKPPFADKILTFQAIFIMLIYLVYDMSFTVQDVSMWGMTAVMSPHSEERGQLAQWGRIGASIGSWIPGLIPVFISISKQIGMSQRVLFAILGVVLGFGGMLVSMSSSLGKERVISDPQKDSVSVWSNLSDLFKNKMVMMVLIGSILSGLSLGIPQIYFFKYKVSLDIMSFHIDGETASFLFGLFSGLPLSPLFDKWVWPLFILGPIVGAVLNIIPLLFIKYPNSLKAKVEKELGERRARAKAEKESIDA